MQANKTQSGLTLVEIMVAITLSMILLAGVVQIFASTKASYQVQQAMARIQENGRLAMDLIQREVSASGYMGCLNSVGRVNNVLQQNQLDENGNPAVDVDGNPIKLNMDSSAFDFRQAVFGEKDADTHDVITLRRASNASAIPLAAAMTAKNASLVLDDTHANYQSLEQWDVAVVSDCSQATVFMITNDPENSNGVIEHKASESPTEGVKKDIENKSEDFEYLYGTGTASLANVFRVGTTVIRVDQSRSNPARQSLFLELNGQQRQEFIEGIENFSVLYGEASSPTTLRVDNYVSADNVNNWSNVLAVRISFDVTSLEPVTGTTGGHDGLLRKHFTTTLRLRNHMLL